MGQVEPTQNVDIMLHHTENFVCHSVPIDNHIVHFDNKSNCKWKCDETFVYFLIKFHFLTDWVKKYSGLHSVQNKYITRENFTHTHTSELNLLISCLKSVGWFSSNSEFLTLFVLFVIEDEHWFRFTTFNKSSNTISIVAVSLTFDFTLGFFFFVVTKKRINWPCLFCLFRLYFYQVIFMFM